MKRRTFIAGLGGAAAWPAVIGYVSTITPEADAGLLNAFRQALRETGFVEGQNVAIEYRWAENRVDRLPQLVADLARRRVNLIVAPDRPAAQLVINLKTAKALGLTIPETLLATADEVIQ
jgi:putative ABC transport system substrate-binding protein